MRPLPPMRHRSKSSHTAHDFWKHFQRNPLDAIFRPRSVALVGATDKGGSVGRTILWNLLSSPFGGMIYPVNINRGGAGDNIFGMRSYSNLRHIPERGIDLAIVAVPARAVKEVSEVLIACQCVSCMHLNICASCEKRAQSPSTLSIHQTGYAGLCKRRSQMCNHNICWIQGDGH